MLHVDAVEVPVAGYNHIQKPVVWSKNPNCRLRRSYNHASTGGTRVYLTVPLGKVCCARDILVTQASERPQEDCASQDTVLPPPPDLGGKHPRKSWNATALAYLGDSVWELYARRKFFSPPVHVASYYTSVVEEVRAEAQATAFENLKEWEKLTEEEGDVLRWGKNASGTLPKRLNKTKVEREIYRQATAMECLVGYLYLTDMNRLHDVMGFLGFH